MENIQAVYTSVILKVLGRHAAGRTFSPAEGHLREVSSVPRGQLEGEKRKSERLELGGLRGLGRRSRVEGPCVK